MHHETKGDRASPRPFICPQHEAFSHDFTNDLLENFKQDMQMLKTLSDSHKSQVVLSPSAEEPHTISATSASNLVRGIPDSPKFFRIPHLFPLNFRSRYVVKEERSSGDHHPVQRPGKYRITPFEHPRAFSQDKSAPSKSIKERGS